MASWVKLPVPSGVDHVAGGGVHLVHQGRPGYLHSGGDLAHLERSFDRGGTSAIDQNFRMRFGRETYFGNVELICSRRQIGKQIGTRRIRHGSRIDIGSGVGGFHGRVRHGRAGGIFYSPRNRAQGFIEETRAKYRSASYARVSSLGRAPPATPSPDRPSPKPRRFRPRKHARREPARRYRDRRRAGFQDCRRT